MRVVIAGGGSVGKFIAERLHKGGHEVLIIEQRRRGRAARQSRRRAARASPWLRPTRAR